jgi:hypothetical protein
MKPLKIILPLALAAVLGGCVLYTFADLGPWDFEDDYIPQNFSIGAVNPWSLDMTDDYDEGDHSLQSGSPTVRYGTSTLTLTIPAGLDTVKDIHFWYKLSADSTDTLGFYVNGVLENTEYGENSYDYSWERINVYDSDNLSSEGPNVLKWVYTRNSATASYDNCAWIDYVEIDG